MTRTKGLLANVRPEECARVVALMDECSASTMRELIGGALAMLRWAIEERKQGRLVGALDDRRHAFRRSDHGLLLNVRRTCDSSVNPLGQGTE